MGHLNSTNSQRLRHSSVRKAGSSTITANGSPRRENGGGGSGNHYRDSFSSNGGNNNMIDDREMLWRLVDEAETNLVAYSEEVIPL